jgi:hypothetical protein
MSGRRGPSRTLSRTLSPEEAAKIRAEIEAVARDRDQLRGPLAWLTAGIKPGERTKEPGAKRGPKPKHDREAILIEAMAYVVENGLPEGGLEALCDELSLVLGEQGPKRTWLTDVLRPFYKRIDAVLKR